MKTEGRVVVHGNAVVLAGPIRVIPRAWYVDVNWHDGRGWIRLDHPYTDLSEAESCAHALGLMYASPDHHKRLKDEGAEARLVTLYEIVDQMT